MARWIAAPGAVLLLAGCGGGFLGLPASERPAEPARAEPAGDAGLIADLFGARPVDLPDAVNVPAMRSAGLERGYGGVILRATGVAPTQGYFDAALVPIGGGTPDAAGIVTLALRATPPPEPQTVGPERTRLLLTAAFVPERALRDIRGFRVVAGANSVTLPLR